MVKPAAVVATQYTPLRKLLCWRIPPHRAAGRIALTFDDGPHPVHSHEVLDVLSRRGIHATFFVVGQQVEHYPDVFRRILADGHEVGIHGYVHDNREMPRQALKTIDVMARFGITSSLFRPPNGVIGLRTQMWMARRGFTTVLWSFDCRDSLRHEGKPGASDSIMAIRAGDIVLLHDDNPVCVDDLELLLDHAATAGLQPHPLRDLLH